MEASVFLAFYFVPAFIAGGRKHHQTFAIFMLNLLLGWTLLGWVVALVWACTAVRPAPEVAASPAHTPVRPAQRARPRTAPLWSLGRGNSKPGSVL
jgi:Superinfection immunity protein